MPIYCYICLGLFYATNVLYLGIVLSEITTMVEKNIIFSTFMPKDFQKLYQEKIKDLRISYPTEKNVNLTGSKEAISKQFPGLLEQISRKYLLLKLGVGFSNEIPDSSVNSSKDKKIILGNAAKMSRKETFSPNYTLFKVDISALPLSPSSSYLWWHNKQSTNNSWNKIISLNLSQLIQFNAVKKFHYYRSSTCHLKLN